MQKDRTAARADHKPRPDPTHTTGADADLLGSVSYTPRFPDPFCERVETWDAEQAPEVGERVGDGQDG
jgi:hypothetical protein